MYISEACETRESRTISRTAGELRTIVRVELGLLLGDSRMAVKLSIVIRNELGVVSDIGPLYTG